MAAGGFQEGVVSVQDVVRPDRRDESVDSEDSSRGFDDCRVGVVEGVSLDRFDGGMPAGAFVARYFGYLLVSLLVLAAGAFGVSQAAVQLGVVKPASYATSHLSDLENEISNAASFDDVAIPSPYWYAHLSDDGTIEETDMSVEDMERARFMVHDGDVRHSEDSTGVFDPGTQYAAMELGDGSWCVVAYNVIPQFSSTSLRDALPNPQTLLAIAFLTASVLVTIAFAIRAAHMLTRSMDPLVDAAASLEQGAAVRDVRSSGIAQVDRALASMVRASLPKKLRGGARRSVAPANGEKAARSAGVARVEESASAAQNDGKAQEPADREGGTPLPHNADHVGSASPDVPAAVQAAPIPVDAVEASSTVDSGDQRGSENRPSSAHVRNSVVAVTRAGATTLDPVDVQTCADAVKAAAVRSDADVAAIIVTSQPEGVVPELAPTNVAELASSVKRAAANLAAVRGVMLKVHATLSFREAATAVHPHWDRNMLWRATMSLVENACDHTPAGGTVKLSFRCDAGAEDADGGALPSASGEGAARSRRLGDRRDTGAAPSIPCTFTVVVEDRGPGFSADALAHARERFYRGVDDRVRGGESHWGLGLYAVEQAARAHGGRLDIVNRKHGGARVSIVLPVRS